VRPLLEQIRDEVHSSWRFRWTALAAAVILAPLGWMVIFALPDRYEATASVFVDKRTALGPMLKGLIVEQDVEAQLNFVRQSLLAGPQLLRIAREGGVLPNSRLDPRVQEQLLAELSKRIQINVRSASPQEDDRNAAGTIYSIFYQDSKRARSLRVVKILLDTLVNETLGGKRAGAQNAQQFLQAQLADYEKRLQTAEDRLADFKSRHMGLMPTEQGGYFAQLQKQSEAVSDVKTKLAEAESRRAALRRQLHGDAAIAAAPVQLGGPGGLIAGTDTLSQIAQTQAHLDELLLKYTDKHPDVIAARETLEELKKRRAAEIASLRRGDASAAALSRASTNPVYQSIQLALNKEDVEIADLNVELAQHQAKVSELRRYLDTAPQVEAEYAQLNRDYDVNKAQYTALLAELQKARLGEQADTAGSVRFEVVQPPTAGFRPAWPPRLALLAGVLAAALAAGAAMAYALGHLRPVVSSAAALAQAAGAPVLGVVSLAFPERAWHKMRRDLVGLSFVLGCLGVAFAVAVIMSEAGFRVSVTALRQLVAS
jgi:polysaccharide chain length determinant protein (PEP-CTERM system associated)